MEYELNALSKNNNKKIFGPLEMDVFFNFATYWEKLITIETKYNLHTITENLLR